MHSTAPGMQPPQDQIEAALRAPTTEREAPARLEDQPDTLAMIEKAFGGARDILMNGTTMRYLSDHIEELIADRVAVAWQASRKQALEEAAQQIESHKTGASLDLVMQGFANEVRHLSVKFHPTPSKGQP